MTLLLRGPRACTRCLRTLERQLTADDARPRRSIPSSKPLHALNTSRRYLHRTSASQAANPLPDTNLDSSSQPPPPETQPISSSSGSPTVSQAPAAVSSTIARKLRNASFRTTETYVAFGVASSLFEVCSQQAAYKITEETSIYDRSNVRKTADGEDLGVSDAVSSFWHQTLELPPTFSTWYQVAFIHMYIITVRLRVLDRDSFNIYMQHLVNAFTYMAEDYMTRVHGMETASMRNKYKRDLFVQWRGVLAAYDEGLVKGDAVLASAVWRNLWKASVNADWAKVATVVDYIRRSIYWYDKASDENILFTLTGDDPEAVPMMKEEVETGGRPKGLFDHVQEDILEEAKQSHGRSKGILEPFGTEPVSKS